uniref:Uncharacterized protein n=1 Tax=Anguilla anguilla TaxID=7936 RepID=A0A0E9VNE8_ANGAN
MNTRIPKGLTGPGRAGCIHTKASFTWESLPLQTAIHPRT